MYYISYQKRCTTDLSAFSDAQPDLDSLKAISLLEAFARCAWDRVQGLSNHQIHFERFTSSFVKQMTRYRLKKTNISMPYSIPYILSQLFSSLMVSFTYGTILYPGSHCMKLLKPGKLEPCFSFGVRLHRWSPRSSPNQFVSKYF